MRHSKMAEWMENVEKAIARIMADKVYTSAEFKRERDNFQVDKFLIISIAFNKLCCPGPLQGSRAYRSEEVAEPDPRDPDGREGQVPAGDREREVERAHQEARGAHPQRSEDLRHGRPVLEVLRLR